MILRNLVLLIGTILSLLAQASDEVRLDHFTRWDDVFAIEATAERSMTLLARAVEIDLNRWPVLTNICKDK